MIEAGFEVIRTMLELGLWFYHLVLLGPFQALQPWLQGLSNCAGKKNATKKYRRRPETRSSFSQPA
jgi:hypothetical protein